MIPKKHIINLLKKRVLILDGAMGTQLQQHGMPSGACPELWAWEHKEIVQKIHTEYLDAGADIIYTNTFGANRVKLALHGAQDVKELNTRLARIARKAAGKKGFVAGDIGPTGQFVKPFGSLEFEEAVDIFKEQIRGLVESGVDLLAIETMMDIQEARAALIAAKECADIFTIVTMTYEKDGRTLNGTESLSALITLQSLGADAVGCNCSTGPEDMLHVIAQMKPYAVVPLAAKPNAGIPRLVDRNTVFDMSAKEFGVYGREFVLKGANLVGGCCGTTPRHISELKKKAKYKTPAAPVRESLSAVSSARTSIVFEKDKPCAVIGERINPTGKKDLHAELLAGKWSLVRNLAREQEAHNADMLDVNVGIPDTDEKKVMQQAINLLSAQSRLPLVIDSANPAVIEAALRIYPGRALINSISGERTKLKKLLPLAARYGAMFILLPLSDKELPQTMTRRKDIIQTVFQQAQRHGFSKDDVIVDALCMTLSSQAKAGVETLKTIEWCSEIFQCQTVIGLSNISFGMPQRPWVNAGFLAMAIAKGLSMAIVNPGSKEVMNIKMATDVVSGKDKDATAFISFFSKNVKSGSQGIPDAVAPVVERIVQAVLEGNREDMNEYLGEALASGKSAAAIVSELMVPAITRVGDLFDRKEYFLPQLIASAETMRKGLGYLEPYLQKEQGTVDKKAIVVLATVEGDIHDIGKNIVALMLKNHGFQVVDLGKDVASDTILDAIRKYQPAVVGLSALMTTTMVRMKEVISRARQNECSCKFILGGAVITPAYAGSLGAGFAKDGVEAVRVVEKLTK